MILYSIPRLKENVREFKNAVEKNAKGSQFYYAMKACYFPGILNIIRTEGASLDVQSDLEARIGESSGFAFKKMLFNSPLKTEKQLREYLSKNMKVVIDSASEYYIVTKLGLSRSIGLRVCGVPKSDAVFASVNDRFGLNFKNAFKLLKMDRGKNAVNFIHHHCFSRLHNINDIEIGLKPLSQFINEIISLCPGICLDIGGGYDNRLRMAKANMNIGCILKKQVDQFQGKIAEHKYMFEPGRYFVEDAAIAITSVVRKKRDLMEALGQLSISEQIY